MAGVQVGTPGWISVQLVLRMLPAMDGQAVGHHAANLHARQTLPIIDPLTGEIRHAQFFGAVLGGASYTTRKASGRSAWPLLLSVLPSSLTCKGGNTVRMHYLILLPQKKVCYFNDCYW